MPAQTTSYFVPALNAEQVVEMAAAPALPIVARGIADLIPQYVPVHHGIARAHTRPRAGNAFLDGGSPEARVYMNSARWHFFEYGVRGQAPTRPVQRSVEALNLRYTPR